MLIALFKVCCNVVNGFVLATIIKAMLIYGFFIIGLLDDLEIFWKFGTVFILSDVVSIPKTNENFRLLYDTKGRFRLHSIRDEEAKVGQYK